MKARTQAFKNTIKLFGRELDSIITYELNGETIELGNENLNSISPHYEGGILKSVMKVLDIDSNIDIPLETIINYQFGVKVRDDEVQDYRDNYDYIDFGNYVVYKSEKQEDTQSYKILCYDKMLYSMKDYEALNITYPISVRNYINAIANYMGLTFANYNETFANYNRYIPNELYLSYDSTTQTYSSLGYTFRDVLDELAEVTASTICINDNDELEIRYITNTNDTIDEEYLKDINVNFGEQFGAINTIVLSRSAGADNIYYPSVLSENPIELKISDNQIMNGNDRASYMPDIYNQLNGLQYYINDYSSTGICYYDLCDRYNVSIGENTYSCVMLNDDIQITQGLEENIYTDLPKENVTDYTKADTTDQRINQTVLMVDKQNGIIQGLVDSTVIVSDTKVGLGSITLEGAYEGQLYNLRIKGNISLLFPQNETVYGYPLVPSDDLVPSNTLTPSSPVPYGNEVHYPSNQLFSRSSNLIIDETEYKLDFDFLNYMSDEICDEFVYDNGTCYIIRRVGIDSEGNMYALDNEVIEPRKNIVLKVKKDSTITLKSFPNGKLSATYLLENEYTNTFATQVDVSSEIKQTADSITEQVNAKVGDDEIIAKLNIAIEEGQGTIELTGDQVVINSDNFTLDGEGNLQCSNADISGTITSSNGTIGGWNIDTTGLSNDYDFYIKNGRLSVAGNIYNFGVSNIYTMSDVMICQAIITGALPTPGQDTNAFKHYDINNNGQIDAQDLLAITYFLENRF